MHDWQSLILVLHKALHEIHLFLCLQCIYHIHYVQGTLVSGATVDSFCYLLHKAMRGADFGLQPAGFFVCCGVGCEPE